MDSIIKQKRVSFSDTGRGGGQADRSMSFKEEYNSQQNWLKRQITGQTTRYDYDSGDEQFATSIAAAAYAVHSLHLANTHFKIGKTSSKEKSRDLAPLPRSRTTETEKRHESLNKSSSGTKPGLDSPLTRKPSKISSSSSRSNNTDAKIDAWERTEIEKIKKRYSKIRSRIQSWEDDKKTKAKMKLQKKKIEVECKKERNQQHYQFKMDQIDGIGRGARAQMEKKMTSEEMEVKERAKKMRSSRAVYFLCF